MVVEESFKALRESCNLAKLQSLTDFNGISQDAYQKLFAYLADAAQEAGFDRLCCPLPAVADLAAWVQYMNAHINDNLRCSYLHEPVSGWQAHVPEVLQAMIELHRHHCSNDDVTMDTIVPALGTDKCPFTRSVGGKGCRAGACTMI